MTQPVIFVDINLSVEQCSQVLEAHGVRRVLVHDPSRVTENDQLSAFVGVVSDADLFKCMGAPALSPGGAGQDRVIDTHRNLVGIAGLLLNVRQPGPGRASGLHEAGDSLGMVLPGTEHASLPGWQRALAARRLSNCWDRRFSVTIQSLGMSSYCRRVCYTIRNSTQGSPSFGITCALVP